MLKSVALFWHISGFAYLTGRPDEENLDAIYGLMQNRDGTNSRRFVLELKDEEMAAYFQKKEDVERHPRYRFQLQEDSSVSGENGRDEQDSFEEILSDGYEIREVDAELLSKISGYVVPSLFWESEEAFLEKGKGYCIVLGIIFSYVTLKTGNCMYAAIMHGVVNIIAEIPVFCSVSMKSGLLGPNPTGLLSMTFLIIMAIFLFFKLEKRYKDENN